MSSILEEHRSAMDELSRCATEYGPDHPETLAAYAKSRRTGRTVRNHYAAIGEKAFGRI